MWESKDISQRFRYRFSDEELAAWAGNVQRLAGGAEQTHVVFNNCYRDYAHANAQQLAERLASGSPSRVGIVGGACVFGDPQAFRSASRLAAVAPAVRPP